MGDVNVSAIVSKLHRILDSTLLLLDIILISVFIAIFQKNFDPILFCLKSSFEVAIFSIRTIFSINPRINLLVYKCTKRCSHPICTYLHNITG